MLNNANFVISKIYETGDFKFLNISYLEVENVSEETIYINEHLRISPNEKRLLIAPDGFVTDFEISITQKVPAGAEPLDSVQLIVLYKKVKTAEEITQETQGTKCKTH